MRAEAKQRPRTHISRPAPHTEAGRASDGFGAARCAKGAAACRAAASGRAGARACARRAICASAHFLNRCAQPRESRPGSAASARPATGSPGGSCLIRHTISSTDRPSRPPLPRAWPQPPRVRPACLRASTHAVAAALCPALACAHQRLRSVYTWTVCAGATAQGLGTPLHTSWPSGAPWLSQGTAGSL